MPASWTPREFCDPPDAFGDPSAQHRWVLPEGRPLEYLFGAVIQHTVAAAFVETIESAAKNYLLENQGGAVTDDQWASCSHPGREWGLMLTRWFEDRHKVQKRTEVQDRDTLVRILHGQDPLPLQHLGWMLIEAEKFLKPDWDEITGTLIEIRDRFEEEQAGS